jgi:hypothetical protein
MRFTIYVNKREKQCKTISPVLDFYVDCRLSVATMNAAGPAPAHLNHENETLNRYRASSLFGLSADTAKTIDDSSVIDRQPLSERPATLLGLPSVPGTFPYYMHGPVTDFLPRAWKMHNTIYYGRHNFMRSPNRN